MWRPRRPCLGTETLRRGTADDLDAIARIQTASPQGAQWDVREYLQYDFLVAECKGKIAGFAVARKLAEGESELLNLAVGPAFRRRGVARRLVRELTSSHPGMLWLEVRESNGAARKLYETLGFIETGRRPAYYADSCESAIVMNIHS
jgi:ribosomal-protein-alanine N-acetyltransferase